ncbi:MAG: hypothetical protein EBX39_07605, partial [Actinobacteria bacterium]|nr:hypothetical protein [Actinomycetota bacterium]
MRGFTTRVGLSLAAASLCFLSIPVAMAADDSTGAPVSTSRFAACAVDPDVLEGETGEVTDPVDTIDDQVDPIPAPDSTDSTDSTGDTSDPTETDPTWEIDPIPMPRPCWYGPIDVPVCRNWPVLIVDPPDITIEPQEPPFV